MLNEALKIIYDEGRKIVDYVVKNELKRGDSPTIYSKSIYRIKRIEGIDYLAKYDTEENLYSWFLCYDDLSWVRFDEDEE